MSDESTGNSEQPIVRRGVFGQYDVIGLKGQDDKGNAGWEIIAYIQNVSDTHDYWVSENEFHTMSVYTPLYGTAGTQVQIHGVVSAINYEEKQAVLDAIASWENPLR